MGKKDRSWREQMGLFRYMVIGPLLQAGRECSLKNQMKALSEKYWELPDGSVRQFAWGTIEEWLYLYRRGGLSALEPRKRRDSGAFRNLPGAIRDEIDAFLDKAPALKTSTIITLLRHEGKIIGNEPSESTIYRYVRHKRPLKETNEVKDRRAFEAPYPGSLMQVDIMYGVYLQHRGKDGRYRKRQTYLVAILDDHSRLLCHGQFYFEQNVLAYLDCLKQAVQKRGIPERLDADNGQVFLSSQVKRIAAKMGTTVIHTKPRDAAAKGKIERFFRTCRSSFFDRFKVDGIPKSLEELNRQFAEWVEMTYNRGEHSGIGTSPLKKWLVTSYKLKLLPPEEADDIFTFEDSRMVKNDGTFSLGGKLFETHSALAGKKVDLKYDPFFPERVYVRYEKRNFGRANLLDRSFNCINPRRKNSKEKKSHEQ
jgi:transposase InsO family protein